jgi:hypothetical protein
MNAFQLSDTTMRTRRFCGGGVRTLRSGFLHVRNGTLPATIMEDMPMRNTITTVIAVASIATAVIATPKPAEARCIGCWVGAGVAAGIIGGALASRAYGGYGYGGYGYGGGYAAPYSGYAYAPRRVYRRYYRY